MESATANPRTIVVPWSDLPPELLAKISKRLPTKIDHRRFRAVCSSWRSSTPPYKFPTIKLPFPFHHAQPDLDPKHIGAYFTLTERIVYHIQLPDSKDPDFWLVKVELDENGKATILNPVTHRKIEIPTAPKVLNILDFDVTEVCSAYALRYVNPSTPDERDDYYDYRHASKVVYSANAENGEYDVMAVDTLTRLWHIKSGDEKWSSSIPASYAAPCYDVAMVKGQIHMTDCRGVWAFDSEFGWEEAAAPFRCNFALKRRLVELNNGELGLVEEMPHCLLSLWGIGFFTVKEPVVDVGVYAMCRKLEKWVDAKAMDGCIVVVGDDCSFCVPTGEVTKAHRVFYMDRYNFVSDGDRYTGFECDCREICNCYYDVEFVADDHLVASEDVRRDFEGFYGHNIGVFDFETGNTGTALMFPQYAAVFWPPPAWLNRT